MINNTITIAVSKGRILKDTLPLLAHAGIVPTDDLATTRKLILDTSVDNIKLVIIRATDVPTYVQYGAADIGVAGKDTLLEHGGEGLYEPLDLQIAKCKLMVAGPENVAPHPGRLRIATKYVKSAQHYYGGLGKQVDIIKLYGSMELAPIVGLSDYIVDLVDTGNTLKANGLVPLEHICDISSRLIVNKASMKMKHQVITQLVDKISDAVGN
ncbi:MAG: ATP phosphoribosyltransferase [Gammaproteobacteria bacterium]